MAGLFQLLSFSSLPVAVSLSLLFSTHPHFPYSKERLEDARRCPPQAWVESSLKLTVQPPWSGNGNPKAMETPVLSSLCQGCLGGRRSRWQSGGQEENSLRLAGRKEPRTLDGLSGHWSDTNQFTVFLCHLACLIWAQRLPR